MPDKPLSPDETRRIAHDLNNHLGVLLGYLSVLQGKPQLDAQTRTAVNEMLESLKLCTDLVRRLLGE